MDQGDEILIWLISILMERGYQMLIWLNHWDIFNIVKISDKPRLYLSILLLLLLLLVLLLQLFLRFPPAAPQLKISQPPCLPCTSLSPSPPPSAARYWWRHTFAFFVIPDVFSYPLSNGGDDSGNSLRNPLNGPIRIDLERRKMRTPHFPSFLSPSSPPPPPSSSWETVT